MKWPWGRKKREEREANEAQLKRMLESGNMRLTTNGMTFKLIPVGSDLDVQAKYQELLYQVSTKHPDETRHETALRYIQEAEHRSDETCEEREASDEEV